MKTIKTIVYVSFVLLFGRIAFAQQANNNAIQTLIILNDSIEWAIQHRVTKALTYESELEDLAATVKRGKELASAFLKMGKVHVITGDFERARFYYQKSHDLFLEINEEANAGLAIIYIGMSYSDEGAYEKALETFNTALDIYLKLKDVQFQGHVYSHMAYAKGNMGDIVGGLQYNLKALEAFEKVGDSADAAIEMSNIGDSYAEMGETEKALIYYKMSSELLKKANFTVNLMSDLYSLGLAYLDLNDLDQAKFYFDSTYSYAASLGNVDHMAKSEMGRARILFKQKKFIEALQLYEQAINHFESVNEKVFIIDAYSRAADCLLALNRLNEADAYLNKAARVAKEIDSRVPYMYYLKSAESLDSARGLLDLAYWKIKEHIHIRDSLFNVKNVHRLAGVQFQYEAEKKELLERAARENKEQQQRLIRNSILLALVGSILFALIIYYQRNKIKKERDRSESLLLNILPEEIAQELKEKGKADARDFDMVSILFTDFKEFTQTSQKLSAAALVNEINQCFEAFDGIIEKYNVEKIKTIGDAYMAAGGLPVPTDASVKNTVLAAIEMQAFITAHKAENQAAGKPAFEMRVGIHTGPVVAGIVGVKKFQYDLWGDTVNTASRMESNSEVGKVNISQATYELLKDDPQFTFESRGKMDVKGKGELEMWFVDLA